MVQDEMIMDDYKPPITESVDEMVKVLKSSAEEAKKALKVPNSKFDKHGS